MPNQESPIEVRIRTLLASTNLDIARTRPDAAATKITPRFMDQKVTPDCLSFIADCALQLGQSEFTVQNIWQSDYFAETVRMVWGKPEVNDELARSEYNKFIPQNLKALAYSGVLSERKNPNGLGHSFRINEPEIITYLSISPFNAFRYLVGHIEQTLRQSGIWPSFERFLADADSANEFESLKETFEAYVRANTFIRGTFEPRRIFTKVINPLAVNQRSRGSKSGRLSRHSIPFSDLMYNKQNWRDDKAKNVPRSAVGLEDLATATLIDSEMRRIMNKVKLRHAPNSEMRDAFAIGPATQVHHIFPRSTHPELRASPENLILLTGTQHNTKAHPNNKTSKVDFDYQIDLLCAKVDSVFDSLARADGFYSLSELRNVIQTGYNIELPRDISITQVKSRLADYQTAHHRRR